MRYYRALGYFIFQHPEYKEDIINTLSLKKNEYEKLTEGRLFLIYPDLIKISNIVNKPIEYLIKLPCNNNCYEGMVFPVGKFSSQETCDKILDLIDSYIDIKESLGVI